MEESLLKLGLAVLAGALIGAEREFRDKSAGFRTMILICVGACLFTQASLGMGGPNMRDPARIAAQIVSGVGFLGAGVIMRDGGKVVGITTASTIWLTAAIGMGIGGGFYQAAMMGAGVVLSILWVFPYVERRIDSFADERTYRIVCSLTCDVVGLEDTLRRAGLEIHETHCGKSDRGQHVSIDTRGRTPMHVRAAAMLMAQADVTEFTS